MTPAEAAEVLVRYYDPAVNPNVEQHLDFPVRAFWTVIDHARGLLEQPWPDHIEGV